MKLKADAPSINYLHAIWAAYLNHFHCLFRGHCYTAGCSTHYNVVKKKGRPCTYYFLHRCLRVTHWLLPAERPSLSSSPSWRYCAVANQPAHLQRAGSWKSFKTGFALIWQNCPHSFLPPKWCDARPLNVITNRGKPAAGMFCAVELAP
jgi:hypothetical protein